MQEEYSTLTFAPLEENWSDDMIQKTIVWLKSTKYKEWGMCHEKGKSGTHDHIHVIATRRRKNFTRDFLRGIKYTLSKKEKECGKAIVGKAHDNPKLMFGYIQKEGIYYKVKGKTVEYMKNAIKYYIKEVAKKKEGYEWDCVSINRLFDRCKVYWNELQDEDKRLCFGRENGAEVIPLKSILVMLHKERKIPFSLYQKYRKSWETPWRAEMEEWSLKKTATQCWNSENSWM